MRYLVVLLASAGSALAHPPPHDLRPPPPPLHKPPVVDPRAMTCTDTHDEHDRLVASTCEVTAVTAADVDSLVLRSDGRLSIIVRRDATQADFDTIAAVPFLRTLSIYSEHVEHLDVLAKFRKLSTLSIEIHAAAALPVVAALPIKALTIGGCGKLDDLTGLAGFATLETLYLGADACLEVARLDGIDALPKLAWVLSSATIADASALARAKTLRYLSLDTPRAPLAAIAKLDLVSLGVTLVHASDADLDAFEHMASLATVETLSIKVDREPRFHIKLAKLTAMSMELTDRDHHDTLDFAFVRSMPNLQYLFVSEALHADLAPLLALHALQSLDVSGICDLDARPLARLQHLKWLGVAYAVDESHVATRREVQVTRLNRNNRCTVMPPPKQAVAR